MLCYTEKVLKPTQGSLDWEGYKFPLLQINGHIYIFKLSPGMFSVLGKAIHLNVNMREEVAEK